MDVGQILSIFDANLGADIVRQTVGEGASQTLVFVAKSAILWTLLPANARPKPRRKGLNWRLKIGSLLTSLLPPGRPPKTASEGTRSAVRARAKLMAPRITAGKCGKNAGRRAR